MTEKAGRYRIVMASALSEDIRDVLANEIKVESGWVMLFLDGLLSAAAPENEVRAIVPEVVILEAL